MKFKIIKVRKDVGPKINLRETPIAKNADNDSSSTKRSSRQSSKLKTPPFSSGYGGEADPINLIKIEEKEDSSFLKLSSQMLPQK